MTYRIIHTQYCNNSLIYYFENKSNAYKYYNKFELFNSNKYPGIENGIIPKSKKFKSLKYFSVKRDKLEISKIKTVIIKANNISKEIPLKLNIGYEPNYFYETLETKLINSTN